MRYRRCRLFGGLFYHIACHDAEEEHVQRIPTSPLMTSAGPAAWWPGVTSETRDRIMENCLGIQLGDAGAGRLAAAGWLAIADPAS